MESVAQYLTRIVRQTEQVQALARSATVTLAGPQSDEPNRVTVEQESFPPAQYEDYLRDGEGLQLYVPLYCSFRGDIVIQERGYARAYALLASELQPAPEFQDSCVFWVDSSFARSHPKTSADPTKRTSAAAAVVYKRWPNKKEWNFKAFGLARVRSSNLAELFAIKAALEMAAEFAQKDNRTCDANDAVNITIVQPDEQKLKTVSSFHPQFTYPIFGDDERIFGYKGLIIRLRFAAHDLRPHLHISYDEKFKPVEDIAAVDILKTLKPWISEEAFVTLPDYEKAVLEDKDAKDFKPPGKLVHSYVSRNRNYEIWAGSLADPKVRRLLDRAQIFVSLFIEAGTPLATDDPEWTLQRWTVYFVYEKVKPPTPTASEYSIVGYATTYRWWHYRRDKTEVPVVKNDPFPSGPEIHPSQLPSRLRIAQFLILPPHQNSGHGRHLYTSIHSACVQDPTVVELTVEDPNEAFDVLRDSADYHILRPEFIKHNVNINPDPYEAHSRNQRPRQVPTAALIPVKLLHDIRTSYKIDSTQFAHILEMFLLSRIPLKNRHAGGANMSRLLIKKHRAEDPNERRYYWWRMLTKQRLYKRSKDILIQLDLDERIQKLEETATNVEEGYEVLLREFTEREEKLKARGEEKSPAAEVSDDGPSGTARDQRVKRKFTVQDDEDEVEEGDTAKRTKV
ncbi:hypothetical protein CNMCM5793_009153 [Aspergillus hiratsukae]|uniref:Histone acetyltransferase type B catalytic subunit n=1 Tax=Aspergillus hiratsukae TaxID=1194566 RepID=A0A8H6P889_9EURO|nr:hypothetical protein CNMCM5793_009153 [Aspergillus hiratsukae]KAF7160118.1 hypothetical protein CNMCM6106_007578 [Aspergillus hiratsukae]